MIRRTFLAALRFYQKYATVVFGYGSCRYYPTCSEYAKQQLELNPFLPALARSVGRLLRCNQLFAGGFDYVRLCHFDAETGKLTLDSIKYWIIPDADGHYYAIKNLRFKG